MSCHGSRDGAIYISEESQFKMAPRIFVSIAPGLTTIAPGSCEFPVSQGQFSKTNCPWFKFTYFKP